MAKPVVFVLDTYHPDAIAHLRSSQSIEVVVHREHPDRDWHAEAAAITVRSDTRLTVADFSQAKHLQLVAKQGVGVDNIDLTAAQQAGVAVYNTPAVNSESVAELTLALATSVARRVPELDRLIRRGEVAVRAQMMGQSLFGKTVGIVGMGNIGRVVARKWIGAMEGAVVAFDPHAPEGKWNDLPHTRAASLDELLMSADVVTLHVPLTPETRGMIGGPQLEKMRRNAILINCARGGIVDEAALASALQTKQIYGAAVDAFEIEPVTLETYRSLLSHENFVATPHIGANTAENQSRSGVAVAETVLAALHGDKLHNRVV